MIAQEDPELVKKERVARRKRNLLRWGVFLYYAILCAAAAIYWSAVYHMGTRLTKTSTYYRDIYYQRDLVTKYSANTGEDLSFNGVLVSNLKILIPLLAVFLLFAFLSRIRMRGMHPLQEVMASAPEQSSRLVSTIEGIAIAMGTAPRPCMVMQATMPNALAMNIRGRPNLVVTSGLLRSDLSQREMAAVVAHESVHMAVGDTLSWRGPSRLFLSLAALISISLWWGVSINTYLEKNFVSGSLFAGFHDLFIVLLMVPIPVCIFLEIMLNRQNDLFADARAAMITRDPEALISAIEKLATSEGTIAYSLLGIGALLPEPENMGALPKRAMKYMFVDPLKRGIGPEFDRRWMVSVHRFLGDNLTIITHPRRKDREKLRVERGERGGLIHDRLAALRQILDGGNYLEAQTLKIPSDMWE